MIKILFIFFILLLILNLKEQFQDALEYTYGAVFAKDVECKKNIKVNNTIKVNQLCPYGLTNCANSENFSFVNNSMPKLSKEEVCIGDQCLNKDDLLYIKNNVLDATNYLKFKVESSGLVSNVRYGISRFFVNGVEFKNLPVGRGFNVLVLNQYGNKHDFSSFDTHSSYDNSKNMINFLNNVPDNHYVLVSVLDEASNKDKPYINIYENVNSGGWKKKYKLNSDGSETKINSTWSGRFYNITNNLFPNDSLSSYDVSEGITAQLFEHDFDKGIKIEKQGPAYNQDIRTGNWGYMNDRISTIRLFKTNSSDIVTPYEALKSFGGTGQVSPNYRGSYIFIGKKGGPGYEFKKNANSESTLDTYIQAEKQFLTPHTFINIKRT